MSELTVRDIIDKGGGAKGLHEASKDAVARKLLRKEIAEKTVYSWFGAGIPERHWVFVKSVCDVSSEQLHQANEMLRGRFKSRPSGAVATAA